MSIDYFSTESLKNNTCASKVLRNLYLIKSSAALNVAEFGDEGKVASVSVSRRTISFLTVFIVFPGFLTLSSRLGLSFPLYFIYNVGLFAFWWYIPIWILFFKKKKSDKEITEWIEDNIKKEKRDVCFKFWVYLVTIAPFSIKTIWMWVVIFGLYSGYYDQALDLSPITSGKITKISINEIEKAWPNIYLDINKFTLNFLRTITLAIVSYIATNIISDLDDLKDKYIDGTKAADKMASDLNDSLNTSNNYMNNLLTDIKSLVFFTPIQKQYVGFKNILRIKYPNNSNSLNNSLDQYSELVASQIELIAKNLTGNSVIDLWTLAGLKSAEELRVKQISTQKTILTSFDLFANMIADCLDSIPLDEENKPEIYTVFALPPDRFLNYNEGGQEISKEWLAYLQKNIDAVRKNIKIHRHFLSFDNTINEITKHDGTAGLDLIYTGVEEKLNEKYYIKDDGMPYFDEHKNRYLKKDDEIEIKLEWQSLRAILVNKYHCNGCCKIIKAKLNSSESEDVIFSTQYKKPIDYFALKSKNDGEWLFCFKAYYDKKLEVARVKFLHKYVEDTEDKKDWDKIKTALSKLFEPQNSSGIKITTIS